MWPFALIGVYVIALLMPFWFFLITAFFFTLRWHGYSLLFVGFLIDAQFGSTALYFPYLYTITSAVLVLITMFLKPHLSFYTE